MTKPNNTDPPKHQFEGDTTFVTSASGAKRQYKIGDTVDGAYQLNALLGQGGMGVVFSCTHIVMKNDYAIKILNSEDLNEEYWTRFRSEAQALARLNHPNIVSVYNMGIDRAQCPYYVMDLLQGESLEELLMRTGRLPVNEALNIFIQVADALGSAHSQGIVHRDIKPSNLMLQRDQSGRVSSVKIVDFGIARLSNQTFGNQSQTKTGLVFGTPFYMSPEQCQGERVDERADIYSLGCTLYEALTGRPPYRGENAFQTFMLHQTASIPSLLEAAPKGHFENVLERAVAKMLAKDLNDRYQKMSQVKHDLERIKAGKTIGEQATTVSPGQAKTYAEIMQQQQRTRQLEPKIEKKRSPKWIVPAVIAAAAVLVGVAGFGLHQYLGERAKTVSIAAAVTKTEQDPDTTDSDLQSPLTDSADMGAMMDPNFTDFSTNAARVKKFLERYEGDPATAHFHFKQNSQPPRFDFPKDFVICNISMDGKTPLMGTGSVIVPSGSRVTLYLTNFTEDWPGMLDNIGPDELTGLEFLTKEPPLALKKIRNWTRLDHLSFFNSLTKALPRNELKYDESDLRNSDLPLIDKMTRLKTLGLCGPNLSGKAIAQMQLLNTLESLRLKRINNPQAVLDVLPYKDNLKEIWLVGMDTKKEELEALTRMKNLETLRIRRSRLAPDSVDYFKRMPKLKHLYLDREWTTDETKAFRAAIPGYEYEPVVDFKYWQMFPK